MGMGECAEIEWRATCRDDSSDLETDDLGMSTASRDFSSHLGIEVLAVTKTKVTGRMRADARHANDQGWVHGGALMGFADHLGALGTIANLPPHCDTMTIESKTNFLKGARPGVLTAESEPLHVGRRTMVWQTTIYDPSGKRIAIVIQTQMVLENATRRPTPSQDPPG
jgi:1,4-dihydroxy-2-naphthoyl-CoA hydrolase